MKVPLGATELPELATPDHSIVVVASSKLGELGVVGQVESAKELVRESQS